MKVCAMTATIHYFTLQDEQRKQDLLMRVCTVSVKTMEIVGEMEGVPGVY